MAAGKYDFLVDQGGAVNRQFTIMDINGSLLPLAGYRAQFSAKLTPDINGALLLNYVSSLQESHITLNINGSLLAINFSGAETEVWPFTNAVYDIFLVSPSNVRTRILQGTISVVPSVTHI